VLILLLSGCASRDKPKYTKEQLAQIPLAQREGLPAASGGLVLAVGGQTITSDEIITPLTDFFRPIAQRSNLEQFKAQARPQVEKLLETKISNILLYNLAKKDAGENVEEALEKAVEAETKNFIARFGGDYAKAEEVLKQDGMDWASFREYQRKMILSQSYISSQMPDDKPVTYSELLVRYNDMKEEFFAIPPMLKFRIIDIQPNRLKTADPNQSRRQQAKDLADELVGRLRAGEDFAELAKQYSHGHRAVFGGSWKPVQPQSLAEPYDILAAAAEKIEPSQITGPIEAGEHIFIMKLEEKRLKSFKPLEEVQNQVEAQILLDRRRNAVEELNTKLMQQAASGEKDEFVDFCLKKIYLISNQ
jgi:parvulin-like peptidyl-prolyl isomerase